MQWKRQVRRSGARSGRARAMHRGYLFFKYSFDFCAALLAVILVAGMSEFYSLVEKQGSAPQRLIGQDLAQSEAVDLSAFLRIHENIAEISGEVVKAVTVSKEGDFSDPGIVLKLLPET